MGLSCCGCVHSQKIITPNMIPESDRQHSCRSDKKFKDIQPLNEEDINISQIDLVSLNHRLEEFIVEYQIKNGRITKRFTKRMFSDECINQDTFQNNKENYPEIMKNNHQIKKETSRSFCKSIKQNMCLLKEEEVNINEIKEQEIKIEKYKIMNEESSFSQNYDSQMNEKNKSCLQSLSSHILNQSIFSQRNIDKDNFKNLYSDIFGVQLQKWTYNDRVSYELTSQQILQLNGKYKDNRFTICIASIYQYWINNCLNLLCYNSNPNSLKIYLNGQPRLYPIEAESMSLESIYSFVAKLNISHITHLTFLISGWIPQVINIADLKQINDVIERLTANLQEGNILITLSKQNQDENMEYTVLEKVDIDNQLIYMNTYNTKSSMLELFLQEHPEPSLFSKNVQVISYQNFIQLFDYININWNPFIYELRINQEGFLNVLQTQMKYIVIIPPSSQDLQLRLMIQKHHNFQNIDTQQLVVKLYEYNNNNILGQPIRTISLTQVIFSDVFIFQSCQQKTSYILTIGFKDPQMVQRQILFTASLLSFAQIKFKPFKPKNYQNQVGMQSQISLQNIGYGINSPYFNKNLQFSISTEIGNDLEIAVNAKKKLTYQICLIPDVNNSKNMQKIKLQTIINSSHISNQCKGSGKLNINAEYKNYILIINSYTEVETLLDVQIKSYGYEAVNKSLDIGIINTKLDFQFNQEIKWLPTHSGPRKRLKSNSINEYQPLSIFKDFFNNPTIQKNLTKGKYQFYIKSITYEEQFNSFENYEDKNLCEPPALSMGIFLLSKNRQQYKIILDDAFYVPFGIGFRTTEIQIQEGIYKFVFPRMDAVFNQGQFSIIKC